MALKTDLLPPFAFLSMGGGIKSTISFAVFPPSKYANFDGPAGKAKKAAQLTFVFLAINQVKNDLVSLWQIATDPELGIWSTMLGYTLVLAASSNMPSAMVAFCQLMVFGGNGAAFDEDDGDRLSPRLGPIFAGYAVFGLFLDIMPLFLLVILWLPAAILYCWVAIPAMLAILCGASVLVHLTRCVLRRTRRKHSEPLLEDNTHEQVEKECEAAGWYPGIEENPVIDLYPEAPGKNGLLFYFTWSMTYPLILRLVTTMARLLDGYGHWEALYLTATEHHLASYLGVAEHGVQSKINLLNIFV